ncbi:MAG: alanyl-tRNA editing protein [Ruminococcaceae bacterium]|nr:alanyl-tRNA editing protein [Oscillospiraceae bacterium]
MTEKLYYIDSYIKEFSANVVSLTEEENFIKCVLDKTAFFPTEGGQSCDFGTIGDAKVTEVKEKDGIITHFLDKAPSASVDVICRIDWKRRFRNMQNHSGEHIVSGLLHSIYGFENVGFHLGSEDVTIDFNGILNEDQLSEIEYKANEAIIKNIEIIAKFPTKEQADKIEYRSKMEISENLRVVTIDGYDICACCAPHVRHTGEIGLIKFLDSIHYKGGTRLHIKCGFDALSDYSMHYRNTKTISNLLSAKQEEVYSAVCRLSQALNDEKAKSSELRAEILRLKTEKLEYCKGNRLIFEKDADMNFLRNYVNVALKSTAEICAAFSGDDNIGYKYIIASETVDLKSRAKEINSALKGNGGGKTNMIQGSVSASEAEIRAYFDN